MMPAAGQPQPQPFYMPGYGWYGIPPTAYGQPQMPSPPSAVMPQQFVGSSEKERSSDPIPQSEELKSVAQQQNDAPMMANDAYTDEQLNNFQYDDHRAAETQQSDKMPNEASRQNGVRAENLQQQQLQDNAIESQPADESAKSPIPQQYDAQQQPNQQQQQWPAMMQSSNNGGGNNGGFYYQSHQPQPQSQYHPSMTPICSTCNVNMFPTKWSCACTLSQAHVVGATAFSPMPAMPRMSTPAVPVPIPDGSAIVPSHYANVPQTSVHPVTPAVPTTPVVPIVMPQHVTSVPSTNSPPIVANVYPPAGSPSSYAAYGAQPGTQPYVGVSPFYGYGMPDPRSVGHPYNNVGSTAAAAADGEILSEVGMTADGATAKSAAIPGSAGMPSSAATPCSAGMPSAAVPSTASFQYFSERPPSNNKPSNVCSSEAPAVSQKQIELDARNFIMRPAAGRPSNPNYREVLRPQTTTSSQSQQAPAQYQQQQHQQQQQQLTPAVASSDMNVIVRNSYDRVNRMNDAQQRFYRDFNDELKRGVYDRKSNGLDPGYARLHRHQRGSSARSQSQRSVERSMNAIGEGGGSRTIVTVYFDGLCSCLNILVIGVVVVFDNALMERSLSVCVLLCTFRVVVNRRK